jgi:hypothetical protein
MLGHEDCTRAILTTLNTAIKVSIQIILTSSNIQENYKLILVKQLL